MSNEDVFGTLVAAQESGQDLGPVSSADTLFDNVDLSPVEKKEEKVVSAPKEKEEKAEEKKASPVEESEKVEDVKPSLEEQILKESLKSDEEKAEEDKKAPVKSLKAKVGDGYQEIPEDATFKIKIDGKYEVRSLAQLRDAAALSEGSEKRFTEAVKERDEAKKEKLEAQNLSREQREATQRMSKAFSKSPFTGLAQMAIESGVEDVGSYVEAVKSQMKEEILQEMNMSDEEIALKRREDNLRAKEESMEIVRRSKEEQEHLSKLETEVRSVLEANKLSVDDFEQGYKSIVQHNKDLDPSTLTPQDIASWIKLEKRGNFIMDQLLEIKPELAYNYQLIADITNKSIEAKLSDETIARLLKEQYSNRVLDPGIIAINEKAKEQQINKKQTSEEKSPKKSSRPQTVDSLWD